MSTGVKLLIGCVILLILAGVALAVALGVGGFALKRQLDSFLGGLEDQQEASQTLERLEQEYPFEVPEDGVVSSSQLDRFVAVTDAAWDEIRPLAEELADLERIRDESDGGPGIRELIGGARALGGFTRARLVLADELEAEGMSLSEYVWTGTSLQRAVEGEGAVPEENARLARENQGRLPAFEDDDEPGPETVLAVATLWGMMDMSSWSALGLDTLVNR
ncbi:MAG: hypothetical protein PVI57_19130 [Gemmatimonadota bacterium]|jgi:hypothetical protein